MRTLGLSRTADGRTVPSLRRRSVAAIRGSDEMVSWLATAAVTLLALFLRLWDLGKPRAVPLRRDLLRQGRVVPHPPRLRHRATSRRQRQDPVRPDRPDLWTKDPSMVVHPEVGKWLIGGGEALFGMDPVRLAVRIGRDRLTDDPGDGAHRAPDDRLHVARRRSRPDHVLRRAAPRAVAARAPRHLPGVLRALRRVLPGRRPRLGPGTAGSPRSRWGGRRLLGPGARDAVPSLAGARGSVVRPRPRHEVEHRLRDRRVRAAGVGLGRGRAAATRRARLGDEGRRGGRAPGVRLAGAAPRP